MSEVNERWQRDNRLNKKLTAMGVVVVPILWFASYEMAWPAGGDSFHGVWFGLSSLVLLLGAIGTTIGTVIAAGMVIADEPPLPGSNR